MPVSLPGSLSPPNPRIHTGSQPQASVAAQVQDANLAPVTDPHHHIHLRLALPAVHLPATSLISHHQPLLKCAYLWPIVYSHRSVHQQPKPLWLLVGPDLALSPGTGQHHCVQLQLAPPVVHLHIPSLTLNIGLHCCGDTAATIVHTNSKCPPELFVGPAPALSPVAGLYHWAYLKLAPPAVHLHPDSQTCVTSLHCSKYLI